MGDGEEGGEEEGGGDEAGAPVLAEEGEKAKGAEAGDEAVEEVALPGGGIDEVGEGEALAGAGGIGVGTEAGDEVGPEVGEPTGVDGGVVVGRLEVGGDLRKVGAEEEGGRDEGEDARGDKAGGGAAAEGERGGVGEDEGQGDQVLSAG